jgi:hypothetical protein
MLSDTDRNTPHMNADDNKVERYKWKMKDEPGDLRWIIKTSLQVDHEYQRGVREDKVLAMAREWSWLACGTLIVAQRQNIYWVVDGQHRYSSAMRRGDITKLPCNVFQTKDSVEEAGGFLAANTLRKPISSLDKFRAQIVTNDRNALIVQSLIEGAGRTASEAASSGTVRCLAVLMRQAAADEGALRRVWPLVVEICRGEALHQEVAESLFFIETRCTGNVSIVLPPWRQRFERLGHSGIMRAAREAAAYYAKGGAKVWAKGVLREVNKRCHTKLAIQEKEEAEVEE